MSTCATGLVTRGYICCNFMEDQLQSCDKPKVKSMLEVRPRVRNAATPATVPPGTPSVVTAQELKPRGTVKAPTLVLVGVEPKPVTAQDLKPKITKAEED